MNRLLTVSLTLLAVLTLALPMAVSAYASLTGATTVNISNAFGSQTDPAIGSNYAVYTNENASPVEIHYYNLITGTTGTVPNLSGNDDVLADVAGNTTVFTRFTNAGSSIFRYEVGDAAATEVSPGSSSIRTSAAIGGNTIAWEDFATPLAPSEIYLNDNGVTVQITNDPAYDLDPALNATGDVVVFTRCTSAAGGCDVYMSTRISLGVWSSPTAVATLGEEADPGVSGTLAAPIIVYSSVRAGEQDIFYTDATGEHRIALTGSSETRPTISDGVIVFESTTGADTNILLYHIATGTLYDVATGPANEQLSDVFVVGNRVQVVFTAPSGSATGQDIFLFTGLLPGVGPNVPTDKDACKNGGWMGLVRADGTAFENQGQCIQYVRMRERAERIGDDGDAR